LFLKFFTKTKSFIKNKLLYLLLIGFLKKILLYSLFKNIIIFFKQKPLYLTDILNIIMTPAVNLYKNPLNFHKIIDERFLGNTFSIVFMVFLNTKKYNIQKIKKKGKIKRKIFKKIILINRLID